MRQDKASRHEIASYQALAGDPMWLGCGALPQFSYFGSILQQKIPSPTVSDHIEANRILNEMRGLRPVITFNRQSRCIIVAELVSFSDASFNISGSQQYGQTEFVSGIRYQTDEGEAMTYHLIDWARAHQRRVSYSSYGAEILGCTETDYKGFHTKITLQCLGPANTFAQIMQRTQKSFSTRSLPCTKAKSTDFVKLFRGFGTRFNPAQLTPFDESKERPT